MREIGRLEADLSGYSWHLREDVDGHPVGRPEVNSQAVKRNHRIIGEPAATFRGNEFVRIVSNFLGNPDTAFSEAEDLGWHTSRSSASTP